MKQSNKIKFLTLSYVGFIASLGSGVAIYATVIEIVTLPITTTLSAVAVVAVVAGIIVYRILSHDNEPSKENI